MRCITILHNNHGLVEVSWWKAQYFAEVAKGMDTSMMLNDAYVDKKYMPYKNIEIKDIVILDDPSVDMVAIAKFTIDKSP